MEIIVYYVVKMERGIVVFCSVTLTVNRPFNYLGGVVF